MNYMLNKNRKQYEGIDIGKFVFAILIVAYHVKPFIDINVPIYFFINAISNIGVIYFFIVSGFLLNTRIQSDNYVSVIFRQIKRLFIMWSCWEILYIPFIFFGGGYYKSIILTILKNVVLGSYAHLWYLRGTIVALLIIVLQKKWGINSKGLFIIACIFGAFGVYGLNFFQYGTGLKLDEISNVYNLFRNGLFVGMPCIVIGLNIDKLHRLPKNIIIIAALVLFVGYLGEYYIFKSQFSVMLILFTAVLVYIISIIEVSANIDTILLRKMSTLVYLIHCNSSAFKIKPIKNDRKSDEIFQPPCNDFSTINFIFTSNWVLQCDNGILCV